MALDLLLAGTVKKFGFRARKGKPSEKMGRKATGLLHADSRAAGRNQHFC
jgi:hypothetical protein